MFNNILPSDIKNPFDGVSPNINVFGTGFSSLANNLLSGVWGVVLVGCAIYVLLSTLKWASARKQARTEDLTEAAGSLKASLVALAFAAGAPILVRAILSLLAIAGK
ncbi:hypothetical protein ACUH95_06370 [Dermabacteraceae bacterium P13101]